MNNGVPSASARVLVVDDDPGLSQVIQKVLRREGYRAVVAPSGHQALDWLKRQRADLMLLDLKLHDIEGREFINALADAGVSVPFIIITGQGDEKVAVDLMKRGALDYLIKDVDFLQFVPEVVRHALTQTSREKLAARTEQLQYKVALALADTLSLPEAAPRIIEAICETIGFKFGELWTVDRTTDVLRNVCVAPASAITAEWHRITASSSFRRGVGFPGRVWASGQPADISAMLHDPGCTRRNLARKAHLHSAVAFPIVLHHEVLGVLAFYSRRPAQKASRWFPLFNTVGSQIGQFIERKRAEEALRHSEANLASAQQIAHVGSYELNLVNSGPHHWSLESCRILGLDPGNTVLSLSRFLNVMVHPEDRARVRAAFRRSARQRTGIDLEYRIVRADGSLRHVHSRAEPVLGANHKVVKMVGTLHDITERKELEKAVQEISEHEQRRIGRDLHDNLGQRLTAIELLSESLRGDLTGLQPELGSQAAEICRLLRETIAQTRALAHGLTAFKVHTGGLENALLELARSTSALGRARCRLHCPSAVHFDNNEVAAHLYRIAQECVNNAVKHSEATDITIRLARNQRALRLAVTDNGKGLAPDKHTPAGMGLHLMRHRAALIGAHLEIESRAHKGVIITCTLPTGP